MRFSRSNADQKHREWMVQPLPHNCPITIFIFPHTVHLFTNVIPISYGFLTTQQWFTPLLPQTHIHPHLPLPLGLLPLSHFWPLLNFNFVSGGSTRCGGGGGGCGHKARLPDMPQSHWACPSPKQRSRDRNARQRSGRAAHVEIHPNIWSAAVHAHRVIGFTHGNVRTIVCECNVIILKKAFNWAINN